jgi:hypothetical protein
MPENNIDGGWTEWSKYVVTELRSALIEIREMREQHAACRESLVREIERLRCRLSVLGVKVTLWASFIAALAALLVQHFLTGKL